ncbi:MAG: hypothetical protein ACOYEO_00020 [bacterium]|jgi:hypothetical protein
MRQLLVLVLLSLVLVSGYYYVRRGPNVVEAYNHTNLIPYEAVIVPRLEPKV